MVKYVVQPQSSLRSSILLAILLFSILPFVAAAENDCLYYFGGKECASCKDVEALLQQLEAKYPELRIERLEAYHRAEDAQLLRQFLDGHQIAEASQGVPAVFMGKSYLIGKQPILELLEGNIRNEENSACPAPAPAESIGIVGEKEPRHILETVTFSRVTGEALRDAFTPTGGLPLLMLAILCIVLLAPLKLFQRLLSFSAGIGVVYFLLGLSFLPHLGKGRAFALLLAIIALAVGAITLLAFLRKKKTRWIEQRLLKADSEKAERALHTWRKLKTFAASGLALFILGLLAGFLSTAPLGATFTLLGGFSTVGFTQSVALPLFVFFIVIFLVPLLLLGFGAGELWKHLQQVAHEKGHSDAERERWKAHLESTFKAGAALAMILLAILILVS